MYHGADGDRSCHPRVELWDAGVTREGQHRAHRDPFLHRLRQHREPMLPPTYTTIMARATLSCKPASRDIFLVAVSLVLTHRPVTPLMEGGCMRNREYMTSEAPLDEVYPTAT